VLYIESFVKYNRRKSIEVKIGETPLGGKNPIRVQTMLNTDTNDIETCVAQSIKCIKAGAEYIRITAQGEKEARNLTLIKESLQKKGYNIPLIADIHFNPKVAEIAAAIVEKVRINPGNYTDKKRLKTEELSEHEYQAGLLKMEERFISLLEICKKHGTAIRIGTNHGSLSDRIMGKFGDTPEGMAESAMEFLRICKTNDFNNVVLSMKASNTRIMVYATRLLIKKMQDEEMYYPVHLGVTEAGEGEDGRIKSAVGIGALLADGIGDTIRVSLTEEPEQEIPVAKLIIDHFMNLNDHQPIDDFQLNPVNSYNFNKRVTKRINDIGGRQVPIVVLNLENTTIINEKVLKNIGFINDNSKWEKRDQSPDYIFYGGEISDLENLPVGIILDQEVYEKNNKPYNSFPLIELKNLKAEHKNINQIFIKVFCKDLTTEKIKNLKSYSNIILLLESDNKNSYADMRAAMIRLINENCNVPVIFEKKYSQKHLNEFQISAACDMGGLFIDGLGDGLMLTAPSTEPEGVNKTSFQILQSTGDRITKTEYVSCPSCGRTQFNLQEIVAKIKSRTSHLKGLKIGIMGCIVNGPGEMADAHYGYVGAGKDKVMLYKGKEIIKKNIPVNEAVDMLIQVIKENGDWTE